MRTVTFCTLAGFLLASAGCQSQSESPETAAPEKKANTPPAKSAATQPIVTSEEMASDPLGAWKKLMARRSEFDQQIAGMDQRFASADPAGKEAIKREFQQLLAEYQNEMMPKLIELAPVVYQKEPTNRAAGEIVANERFQKNRYEESAQIADALLEAGASSPLLYNLAGASHFAMHDFAKSGELLGKAKEKDGPIFERLGARFADTADDYQGYWETEQKIRAKEAEADDLPRVKLATSRGDIVVELFENEAPNTVANFINLVENKVYDGTAFHRVIPNFMAQGGDPNTRDADSGNDGLGDAGYQIACECYAEGARRHFRGSLSMAHAGKDTGGSQFFLTHLPTPHLNADADAAGGPRGHTVFGRIIEGLDVSAALEKGDTINAATVIRKRAHPYEPEKSPAKTEKSEAETEKSKAETEKSKAETEKSKAEIKKSESEIKKSKSDKG